MDNGEKKLKIDDIELLQELTYNSSILMQIDNHFNSVLTLRGNNLIIKGNALEIKSIELIIRELSYVFKKTGKILLEDVNSIIEIIDSENKPIKPKKELNNVIYWGFKDVIKANNSKQKEYYKKVLNNDLVFAVGPAGTGKTFLAVAMALKSLKENQVSKIIISRPAVEAGESLGFLPGDLSEKLDPYLRPLTDAMFFMVGAEKFKSMVEKNIVEITPLAYMRGRTLNDAFIILDEAQNSTVIQMKMFLTRLGRNSKAVVTGDITQIDLKDKSNSGLIEALNILKGIKGIDFVYFDKNDVVRHKLVSKIINAYEQSSKENGKIIND